MNVDHKLAEITTTMITFGMGASTQALFARVGGGIYTVGEQKFALGTRIHCIYGANKDKSAELVYIKATATLTAGYICELPEISGTDSYVVDTVLTTTNASAAAGGAGNTFRACVPAAAMVSGEYGWAFVKGIIPIFTGTLAVAGDTLHTTATAGLIDDAVTANRIDNTFVVVTVGGANAISDCFCSTDLTVTQI
jgi:hypothetical protein